ncbi:hypothetical protein [Paraburkholderia sp. GAS334]|jgi:hypothetical protein|uniref:hypothetical protein n=1 Tax=Paraburkholderia sp. GAS334 TaxID=3035131 RepID=UPI003D2397F9
MKRLVSSREVTIGASGFGHEETVDYAAQIVNNRSPHPSPTRIRNACSPAHRIRRTIVPISAAIKDRRDPMLGFD